MSKPFSIQAPEQIAKEYAGNKQKIAQAAQMGIVDPTAAVLAGMFIDRMRSAQVMEAAQQPTVAQQVLGGGGVPQPPGNASPMAPATLSSPPPPMQAPMGAPAPQAPMGMADGGLASLPVPDMMFDEPDNGGYSGGGLVAFADGGMADLYDDVEYVESRGDPNALSSKGARGVMQLMPGTMRDPGFGITPMRDNSEEENRRVGQQYLDAMYKRYGDRKLALMAYNWGPGNVDKWLKAGSPPNKVPKETRDYVSKVTRGKDVIAASGMPERNASDASGRAMSRADIFEDLQRRFGPTEREQAVEDAAYARAEEMGSDEYYEKQRKDSMWETLANIGFNMASSKSPYLLQAVSEAAAAAMPGAQADKKERKQLKDRALAAMSAINGKKRSENLQLFGIAVDIAKDEMGMERFERELEFKAVQGELDRAAQLAAYQISAAGKASDLETATETIYASLKKSNEQGLLTKEGKQFTFADEALRRQALYKAAELLKKNKGGAGDDVAADINTRIGAGGGGPQNPAVNYQ